MSHLSPVRAGVALGVTAAVLYIACVVLVLLVPGALMAMFATWAHGLNIGLLTRDATPLTWVGVVWGLLTFTAFSFVTGVVYGWVRKRLECD